MGRRGQAGHRVCFIRLHPCYKILWHSTDLLLVDWTGDLVLDQSRLIPRDVVDGAADGAEAPHGLLLPVEHGASPGHCEEVGEAVQCGGHLHEADDEKG